MNSATPTGPMWSTSSFGHEASMSEQDLDALSRHLSRCRRSSHHLFSLRCSAEAFRRAVSSRVVSTLAGLLLLGFMASLLF